MNNSQDINTLAPDEIRAQVRQRYGRIALDATAADNGCCTPSERCCGGEISTDAASLGYSAAEASSAPAGANLGLGCGNPLAIASLQPGQTVLDLGAGAGFDCFLAVRAVGPTGRVIGVDMTHEMLAKARANAAKSGHGNVEFRLGEIEALPVADASVDVILSNCVINLSPDKPAVWQEIARVLRPGGRVFVSDLALLKPLPESIVDDVEALVGCVAGAELIEETERHIARAGLARAVINSKPQYVEAMTDWQDPLYRKIAEALGPGEGIAAYVTSIDISGWKA
jgi:SAM-dependent methyltransferase